MTRRYYAPDLPLGGGPVTLSGTEAHHAAHVMRVRVDDPIELFDGQGNETSAVITDVDRRQVVCDSKPSQAVDREPTKRIHLGIALPKPDRARELIERLTELGVQSVTPLVAQRTQRPPAPSLIEKLRRGVIEACKQSGRNQLLELKPTQPAGEFFVAQHDTQRIIAHAGHKSKPMAAIQFQDSVVAAIGPEGGWTEEELGCAIENQFHPVDLGTRIYRIETAATVIASLLVTDSTPECQETT